MLTFGVGILAVCPRGEIRRPHGLHLVMGAFLLWALATLLWTFDAQASYRRLFTYAQLVGMAWLVWQFAAQSSQQVRLMEAYVLGAYVAVTSTIISFQAGRTYGGAWDERYSGGGLNPNDLALVLALAVPMAWYLGIVCHRRSRIAQSACWLYCPLALFAILLSGTRGGFIAACVGSSFIPWTYPMLRRTQKRALVVLVLACVCSIPALVPQKSLDRFHGLHEQIVSGDWTHRKDVLRAGADVFSKYPLLGIGCGAFPSVVPQLQSAVSRLDPSARASHNAYLSVLVEQGVIGLALF